MATATPRKASTATAARKDASSDKAEPVEVEPKPVGKDPSENVALVFTEPAIDSEEAAKQRAEALQPAPKSAKGVKALTAEDLIDQKTGSPSPLSFQTDNLQATVSGDMGRVLVKVAVKGYIGGEPVVILGADIDEFRELADALDKAATKRQSENKKK
jgi:hypothetical protein